ncbi:MAG: formate dehydrogenase accessory protein FdhE, partial [Desulfamplus sp.]|nr:formate dehydrogenase accessory protein FdhE [Desulfamplus sp.]
DRGITSEDRGITSEDRGITSEDRGIISEQIKKSALKLRQARPAYEELINFYEEFFLAQEESRQRLDIDPIEIELDKLKLKSDNGMPLIDSSHFKIDMEQAEILLKKICTLALNKTQKLSSAAKKILQGLSENRFKSEDIFNSLLKDGRTILKETSKIIDVSEEELIFFAFWAIAPAIRSGAQQLEFYLSKDKSGVKRPDVEMNTSDLESVDMENSDLESSVQRKNVEGEDTLAGIGLNVAGIDLHSDWKKGYCPICGNLPQMAFLNQDGEKYLICGFCQHQWKTSRMGCALCQNKEKEKQHYFYNEEEKEYRVDLCDSCGKYIKLIDLRELTRDFYPQLELLCTLHLDIQATEQGYASVLQTISKPT